MKQFDCNNMHSYSCSVSHSSAVVWRPLARHAAVTDVGQEPLYLAVLARHLHAHEPQVVQHARLIVHHLRGVALA